MSPLRPALLALVLAALPAHGQTLVAAGDPALSLAHLVHGHAEGLLLTLPGAGRSLAEEAARLLDREPLLALGLSVQELSADLPAGRQLQALRGWSADRPHWALVAPGPRVLAEGTTLDAETLLEAYRHSGLRSRTETLRAFLRLHPDHTQALAQLILELRGPAETLTLRRLGLETAPAAAPAPDKPRPEPPQLPEDVDAALWDEYAGLYARLLDEGHWLEAGDDTGPLPVAAPLVSAAIHSPRLRALAERLLPSIETAVRRRPESVRRWQVWLSLRQACGRGRPTEVLAGLQPPPGTRAWPPTAAVDAFVEEARQSGDWRSAEPVLQAAFDQQAALLDRMDDAALEDAGQGSRSQVRMGTYFGFGGWTGELSLLVEAKLRLHKLQEADQLLRAAYARVSRRKTLDQAAALARECGEEDLATRWERLGR